MAFRCPSTELQNMWQHFRSLSQQKAVHQVAIFKARGPTGVKALMDDGQRTKHHDFGGVEKIKDHKHAGLVNLNTIILGKEATTDRPGRGQPTFERQDPQRSTVVEVEEGGEYR